MKKLTIADVKDLVEYERIRETFRRRIIDLKERRRVALGDRVSVTFENRETALSQIQEMVRAERIVDEDRIQFEVDTYNALIPGEGELSATLFIEITDASDIRRELDRFIGLDRPGTLSLHIGATPPAEAEFEAGHSNEARISAVHYLRFRLTPQQRAAFLEGAEPVALVVKHPYYEARAVLSEATRASLAEDLRS